jgi:hypothetical protein
MTIQVKYCGGCNPGYNRSGLVGRIAKDFPEFNILCEMPAGEKADFVLVVCGCPVRCASHEELWGLSGKWVISSPDEYPLLYKELHKVEQRSNL